MQQRCKATTVTFFRKFTNYQRKATVRFSMKRSFYCAAWTTLTLFGWPLTCHVTVTHTYCNHMV